jgi:leucyl-tRNA synthetase
MELINYLNKFKIQSEIDLAIRHEVLKNTLLMLSPIIPHITHKLWYKLGFNKAIIEEHWPKASNIALVNAKSNITIQVNGKVRGHLMIDNDAKPELVEKLSIESTMVQKYLLNKKIIKIIHIKNKLINIVIGN